MTLVYLHVVPAVELIANGILAGSIGGVSDRAGKVLVAPWSATAVGRVDGAGDERVSCGRFCRSEEFAIRCCSMTCLRVEVAVSTCKAVVVTVTTSVVIPSFRPMFTVSV